jgi:hypothetical protein
LKKKSYGIEYTSYATAFYPLSEGNPLVVFLCILIKPHQRFFDGFWPFTVEPPLYLLYEGAADVIIVPFRAEQNVAFMHAKYLGSGQVYVLRMLRENQAPSLQALLQTARKCSL